jgi:protein-S-isoprenylcysteine O-methyltransferase Ste14
MAIAADEPASDARSTSSLLHFLMTPWVDKTIAILACLPFVVALYLRIRASGFDLPRVVVVINVSVLVATMISRRVPTRITPNPLFWLLTFVSVYWWLAAATLAPRGRPLMPAWGTDMISVSSGIIYIWARLSLGRNIGLVPAQRQIVTRGAYRYMRHPIYTGTLLGYFAVVLRSYSSSSVVLFSFGILWTVIKCFVEESFLRADPQYAAYLQRVRWRWVPGII